MSTMDSTSCIDDPKDGLQPSLSQLDLATKEARKYWYSLAAEAMARLGNAKFPEMNSPQDILCKVPSLPARQLALEEIHMSNSGTKAIFTPASSTMHPTAMDGCEASHEMKKVEGSLLIGIQSPYACHLTGSCFGHFGGEGRHDQSSPNFTGILSLAWAYILSTRLVELQQQEGSGVSHTGSTAPWQYQGEMDRETEDATSVEIDIGEVDGSTARWWAAILAPKQGWKTTILQLDGEEYISPWSFSLDEGPEFRVLWQTTGSPAPASATYNPLSSQTALRLLAEFSCLHDLGTQFMAAFFATLTFPTHNFPRVTIELPLPTVTRGQVGHFSKGRSIDNFLSIDNDIPSFMALSCNSSVVMSSVCGSFWEPDVTCNLVSPWLHPVLEEIPEAPGISGSPERYHEIIAVMCGIRRPRLSGLWIGAALTGLVPTILKSVREGTPDLDPDAYSWTASPQSFMNLPGSGPYFHTDASWNSSIRREDAWRLLYLPPSEDDGLYYKSLPFSPWPPPGTTIEQNCALRVRAHNSCPRHRLFYSHWTWQLKDGTSLDDHGFRQDDPGHYQHSSYAQSPSHGLECPHVPLPIAQDASREASLAIFRWVLVNQEGKPKEPIYNDDWIAGCEDIGDGYIEAQNDCSSESHLSDGGEIPSGQTIQLSSGVGTQENPLSSLQKTQIMDWVKDNAL